MDTPNYTTRRGEIEHYFDRSAAQAWARLTSDAPLGRIRASVRAGRERMGATLLSWLPQDLRGARVLDAGCGTGALAVELVRRGADVLAVDLANSLLDLAWKRVAGQLEVFRAGGRIEFRCGDMLDASFGRFDHVVAMDSLIHYRSADVVRALETWAPRIDATMLITFAPRTPALAAMHAVGRLFPRGDRAPAIEPVGETALRRQIQATLEAGAWRCARTERIAGGFYTSQALELAQA